MESNIKNVIYVLVDIRDPTVHDIRLNSILVKDLDIDGYHTYFDGGYDIYQSVHWRLQRSENLISL
ncbi:hypothetical protein TSUD_86300 [Trifolium subterraneum]|uniref:Uncharacterized protein n=1 Tax=Trifolium subterraneum TaxID=3900 RepID=A0A2Z6PHX0_TRISU|nr:hypothetical protein TSUD_86300 [Trifolium subterraneum]